MALRYDTAFVLGGSGADTSLLTPDKIRNWRDGVIAFDLQSRRVTAIDENGVVRWIYERQGQGPGELQGPIDGLALPNGSVVVLDPMNRKLIRLSAEGEFLDESRLPTSVRLPWDMVPTGAAAALIVDNSNGQGAFLSLATAEIQQGIDLPLSDTMPPDANLRLVLASDTVTGLIAIGMRFGPEAWIRFSSDSIIAFALIHHPPYRLPRRRVSVGDNSSMPDPTEQVTRYHGAVSIAVDQEAVSVLTGGAFGSPAPGAANDIVDVYDHSGIYQRSYRLPIVGHSIVKKADRLYVLFLDPAPGVLAVDVQN